MAPNYRIEGLEKNNTAKWNEYCLVCPNAWYWHTVEFQDFIIASHAFGEVHNRSFIVYNNDLIAAVVPLLICEVQRLDGILAKELVFSGWSTPYPAINADLTEKETESLTQFIFGHIHNIAQEEKALRSVFSILYQQEQLYERCMKMNIMLKERGYLDISEYNQIIDLSGDISSIESGFRERYMRYIRANNEKLDVGIITDRNISDVHCDECREVCSKDSSQEWPESKIAYLYKTITAGNGIFIRCSLKEDQLVIGYLFVVVYKGYAFDFAVAVNDAYKDLRVSQAMKLASVRYLKSKNIKSYDLGIATIGSSIYRIASEKQRAITHFKGGFANDIMPMFIAEKYFEQDYFHRMYQHRIESLENDLFTKAGREYEKI